MRPYGHRRGILVPIESKKAAARTGRAETTNRSGFPLVSMISALPTQARFFFLLVPRLVAGRCSATRLAAYAMDLKALGSHRLGAWCWNRTLRDCAQDATTYETVLNFCLRAGHYEAVNEIARRFYDAGGLLPVAGVDLVGKLVLNDAFESALDIYDRILQETGEDLIERSPAPAAWDRHFQGRDFQLTLKSRMPDTITNAAEIEMVIGLARLCFSFGIFDTSAALFAKSRALTPPGVHDRIAEAYALSQSDRVSQISPSSVSHCAVIDPDWRILRASVLFECGDAPGTTADVGETLRTKYREHPDLDRIIADCKNIVTALAACPEAIGLSISGGQLFSEPNNEPGLRKLFVCGNGWTGSGALYDALTEYDGLAEMPEAPGDRFLNDCTGNEMMFVQGPSGLGRIWRTARQKQVLRRSDLWRFFRCHVLGAGAIGYSEHKSVRIASHLTAVAGSRYTSIFRSMFEAFAELRDGTELSTVHRALNEAAESLTAAFAGDRPCIVFNNAVFGRDLDMLAIFRNFRAAAVVRDPLDTYADRRDQDLKHWMTPAGFVPFYRGSRQAIQRSRQALAPEQAAAVREVEFENFVLDEAYRQTVIDWLLEETRPRRIRNRFEPAKSALNVGLYRRLLSSDERAVIEKELGQWRRS